MLNKINPKREQFEKRNINIVAAVIDSLIENNMLKKSRANRQYYDTTKLFEKNLVPNV